MIAAHLHRRLRDSAVEVTLTILTPYIAYLPAERLGFSGVLAVVAAGLHRSPIVGGASSRKPLAARHCLAALGLLVEQRHLILIGLQFPRSCAK